jgi:hypothetical protein
MPILPWEAVPDPGSGHEADNSVTDWPPKFATQTSVPSEAMAQGPLNPWQVITRRQLKANISLTTNLGVGSWEKSFDRPMVAAAVLHRLLHQGVVFVVDGDSYRMREHRARSERARTRSKRATQGGAAA